MPNIIKRLLFIFFEHVISLMGYVILEHNVRFAYFKQNEASMNRGSQWSPPNVNFKIKQYCLNPKFPYFLLLFGGGIVQNCLNSKFPYFLRAGWLSGGGGRVVVVNLNVVAKSWEGGHGSGGGVHLILNFLLFTDGMSSPRKRDHKSRWNNLSAKEWILTCGWDSRAGTDHRYNSFWLGLMPASVQIRKIHRHMEINMYFLFSSRFFSVFYVIGTSLYCLKSNVLCAMLCKVKTELLMVSHNRENKT